MKLKSIFFSFLMLALSFLTVLKYREISASRKGLEYSLIISINDEEMNILKEKIKEMTYNSIIEEKMENGKYRIKIKCSPEKFSRVKNFLQKSNLEIE